MRKYLPAQITLIVSVVTKRDTCVAIDNENGQFVFGPLCPGKEYAIEIFVNEVKHVKVCAKCHHEGKCLKAMKCDKCDCIIDKKHCDDKPCCDSPICK